MRLYLFLVLFILTSCNYETKVSGVIIDKTSNRPVAGVVVRTIKDINNSRLEFESARSLMDGRFSLIFHTRQIRDNEVSVELSKDGYRTNMYSCRQDKPDDTLFLEKVY
jgi:hypothetical protein